MPDETANTLVPIPDELADEAEAIARERGFAGLNEFVEAAVRDAVQTDDPYTEEARQEMEAVRRAYERGEGDSIETLFEQLGMTFPPEDTTEE